MSDYSVTVPDGTERGIVVRCEEHDEAKQFQPGFGTVAFHCERCGYELELTLHDLHDWRDFGELC